MMSARRAQVRYWKTALVCEVKKWTNMNTI